MSKRMNDRTKKLWENREIIAREMIEKYGGYSLISLLNLIVELEEKEKLHDTVLKEYQNEATERNAEINNLYREVHLLNNFIENMQ